MQTSRCRSCGAEIYWLPNDRTFKQGPINVAPDPHGNVVLTYPSGASANTADPTGYHVLTPTERRERDAGGCNPYHSSTLHTSHFKTCPQASAWKRGGR